MEKIVLGPEMVRCVCGPEKASESLPGRESESREDF